MDVENRGLPFNSVLDGDANAVNEEPAEQAFAHLSASAVFEGLEWTVERLSACFTLTVASRHVLEAVFGEPIIQGRRGFVPHLRVEGHIKLSIALNTLLDQARQETWIGLPHSSIPAGKYPFVASRPPPHWWSFLCCVSPFLLIFAEVGLRLAKLSKNSFGLIRDPKGDERRSLIRR